MSVEIETCDNVESMAMRENVQTVQPGKYKFINQVIDGMTIQINEVNITFKDPAFRASVQVQLFYISIILFKTIHSGGLNPILDGKNFYFLIFSLYDWAIN